MTLASLASLVARAQDRLRGIQIRIVESPDRLPAEAQKDQKVNRAVAWTDGNGTVYLVQIGYISMQPGETTAARMARVAGYVAIFTGRKPKRRELDRFFARRGFVLPEVLTP